MRSKTLIVVQARTGSSRLPGKIHLPICGKPLLVRMLERVLAASGNFEVTVATTLDPVDDAVRAMCREVGVNCFSGHPTDLLDRHYHAARMHRADVVVKIPSDCPLIDPAVIDKVLSFPRENYDFVSNLHPATYPDGNDVEVMPFAMLERAFKEAKKPHEREHTTPFLWDQPERFRIANVAWETGLDYSMSHRFTIDYPEDYEFIRAVYDQLWSESAPIFSLAQILKLLESRPDIMAINAKYAGVNWYRHHLDALKTVSKEDTRLL